MTRYIIQSRVSTEMQKVESQISECMAWIEQRKKAADTILHFDEPETSSRIDMEDRPILQEMLKVLRKGDVLVIWSLDRLARDGEELVSIYRSLVKRGVVIHSLCEPKVDRATIHIYAFKGEIERESISIRTKSGLKHKKQNGERVGNVLWGFSLDPNKLSTREKAKSEGKPYLLVENPEEKSAIKLMVDLYNQGLSFGRIAEEVWEAGHRTRIGTRIEKMQVYRIIQRQRDESPSPQEEALTP